MNDPSQFATTLTDVSGTAVVDHLTEPRKKKKNFVVIAFSKMIDPEVSTSLEKFIRSNFSGLSVVSPRNEKDILKIVNRQINLIMIDDGFGDLSHTFHLLKQIKMKKSQTGVPVLFFTEDADRLIRLYRDVLLPYQEADDYIVYRELSPNQIASRVQKVLKEKPGRRSRRFRTKIDINVYQLTKDAYIQSTIVDLSLHGAVIHSAGNVLFKNGDQLRVDLPVKKFLDPKEGEFIKLSAKVKRALLGGNEAAISWEHLSEAQILKLTKLIVEMVKGEMTKKSSGSPTVSEMLKATSQKS